MQLPGDRRNAGKIAGSRQVNGGRGAARRLRSRTMIEPLKTIAALLHKYAPRQAAPVEALIQALAAHDPNFALDVCGEILWAERGLWDTGPQVLQRRQDDAATARADELAYRRAFLDLAAAISERGWGTDGERARVREVADTFQAWEREGL